MAMWDLAAGGRESHPTHGMSGPWQTWAEDLAVPSMGTRGDSTPCCRLLIPHSLQANPFSFPAASWAAAVGLHRLQQRLLAHEGARASDGPCCW